MTRSFAALLAFLVVAGAEAQEGIKRTPLQRLDVPDSGYETVMGLAEVAPGATSGRHTHPGIEIGYVLEGESVLRIDGQPDQALAAGDSYRIEAGAVHEASNLGETPAKVIAVYVVEKGKPLALPAQ
ncbi:MAG: cupin domain-containing protein [Alphaproteobacteria bacterium]